VWILPMCIAFIILNLISLILNVSLCFRLVLRCFRLALWTTCLGRVTLVWLASKQLPFSRSTKTLSHQRNTHSNEHQQCQTAATTNIFESSNAALVHALVCFVFCRFQLCLDLSLVFSSALFFPSSPSCTFVVT